MCRMSLGVYFVGTEFVMKQFLTLLLLTSTLSAWGEAVISSVNFNPSRLGEYQRLVVTREATLPGGLETKELTVKSGGGEVNMIINHDTTSTPHKGWYLLLGTIDTDTSAGSRVIQFPNAIFRGLDSNNLDPYDVRTQYRHEPYYTIDGENQTVLPIPAFTVGSGGKAEFTQDSKITLPSTSNKSVYLQASTLKTTNLEITGGSEKTDGELTSTPSNNLMIGKIEIPYPDAAHSKVYDNSGNLRPGFRVKILSDCRLAWKDKVDIGSNTRKSVLAFDECPSTSSL